MIMSRKLLLMMLFCVLCSIHAIAQTDYYYYKGTKIPLTLNENKVCVSIPKTCENVNERIRANVQVLSTIKDDIFNIIVISQSDFEKLTSQDFWEEDVKSVVLTSCYYTENNKEVAASPYLNVKLKKEEDADLLDSYAEKYRLMNLGSFSQYLPLWYVLYVTPESEKSPLECANELYESGDFASSAPDLVSLTSDLLPPKEDDTDNSDYLPLVKEGKTWHMVVSKGECNMSEYMLMNEEVVKDGKTYFRLYSKDGEVVHDLGLLREENCKVYFLPPYMQEEFLLFDYSLKEGDTFETYSYDEQKMVSYEVVSVEDYLEGPEYIHYIEKEDGLITQHRNLQKWTVCRTDDKSIQKTWIEGIGSFGGPLDNLYDAHPISTMVYLAYVDDNYGDLYLPFSFYDSLWGLASGCDLPTGAKDNEESDDGHHHLTYELEGDRLHVYGKVITQCGPNNYAYFFEKETDDPSIHMIEFEIQEVEPTMDCDALHATDFYVSGFDPNLNYIVVDNQGVEHQVINKTQQMAYRPFIEEGKVWIVRVSGISPDGSPMEPYIEYCYFDGDTIIGGQTCKRMMCVTNDNPSPRYIGAWYEQDKKVYFAGEYGQQLELLYDFTLSSGDNIQGPDGNLWTVNKITGDITGFKGTYYDLSNDIVIERWFEGVGSESWPHINHPEYLDGSKGVLLACIAGDDVIYYNSEEDDPYSMGARKRRFDFTHTIKTKPQSRTRNGAEDTMYGEYNDQQLCIHLDQIDDTYLVSITSESGKAVYEKEINAGNIVALNIDISTYAEGRYTVTVENSRESFTGEFGTQMTGIKEISNKKEEAVGKIYNLQGQRLSSLQRGLNIVNGQKIYVK